MAPSPKPIHSLILFLTLSLLISSSMANFSFTELEAAIFALQINGFNLFGNSIAVSNLSVQILSHSFNSATIHGVGRRGFTFLAPPNSVLFSLDMNSDAFTYVHSLCFHIVPRRLSFSELRNVSLSSNPHVETLVPGHFLSVASSGSRRVSIDGIRVSFPDLYLRSNVAVHGLDGILVSSNKEFFHRLDSVTTPPPILAPSHTPISVSDGFKSVSAPPSDISLSPILGFPSLPPDFERIPAPVEAYSPESGGFLPFPPEFGHIPAPIDSYSPLIEGIPPYSPDYGGSPAFPPAFDEDSAQMNAFSPDISEVRSPIGAFSPNFGEISAFHDVAFSGGSLNSISIPPIDAYSSKNDDSPSPSPSMEFLSPDEYSMSPEYAEWLHTEFLSPNSWSPVASVIPRAYTVGEMPEN